MPKGFSHSRLNCYRTCPRQYKFRYVEKVKVPHITTADLELGRIVHEVLASIYELSSFDKEMPLDDALAKYQSSWERQAGREIVVRNQNLAVDDYIESGHKMIEQFYEKNRPFATGTNLGLESNIGFDLPGSSIKMQAKLDRLWKRPDGVIEIIDYKTGRHLPRGGRDPHFFDQMGLYQLGVQATWPQFENIELVQPFLRLGETIRHVATEEEIDLLVESIRSTVIDIAESEKFDNFKTVETGLCHFCDYAHLCPAKRHARMIEDPEAVESEQLDPALRAKELATRFIAMDLKGKEIKQEQAALREELIEIATMLQLEKLSCAEGEVSIRGKVEEKFITKKDGAENYASLNAVARELGLEDYFSIDAAALMKDIYRKRRLDAEGLKRLEPFVKETRSFTVRAKAAAVDQSDD